MENIMLFLGTVALYLTAIVCLDSYRHKRDIWNYGWKRCVKILAPVTLLVLPINIGGNVFTIAGNAVAEKSIYSLFSLYQNAGQDAVTGIGLTYQKAGRDAVAFDGLAYQNAGRDAKNIVGLTYQKAGRDAVTGIGLTYQKAGRDAVTGIGLTIYQNAKENASVFAAIALYQRVGEKMRAFGTLSSLTKD